VTSIRNFASFSFIIPVNQTDPVLDASDTVKLHDEKGNFSTVADISTTGGTAPMRAGTDVTLIRAVILDLADEGVLTQNNVPGTHGSLLRYNWTVTADEDAGLVTARVRSVQAAPEAKALPASILGGVALATQGADLAAGQGMSNAIRSTQGAGPALSGFGAMSLGSMRYKTGSHVDMNSFSLMVGLAAGGNFTPGRATLGAFFEYGTGSYDTYNSFSIGSTKGTGDTYYLGGGLLGRMDFTNKFYTEASARMGRIHNKYNNNDLRDAQGRKTSYDFSTPYYGLHLGTGYVWNVTEQSALDLYGKFFWTRVDGKSVRLSTGDPVTFKDADSTRLRFGGRFSHAVSEYISPYIGAAYEHEFDGKARASTYGYSLGTPKMSGSTGIGEIGLTLNPSRELPLFLDLGVQGYTGKREGVTGSLQLRFEF